jgi:hypothetical protein
MSITIYVRVCEVEVDKAFLACIVSVIAAVNEPFVSAALWSGWFDLQGRKSLSNSMVRKGQVWP